LFFERVFDQCVTAMQLQFGRDVAAMMLYGADADEECSAISLLFCIHNQS